MAHGPQREIPAVPHSSGATIGECRGHGRADHPLAYRPHAAARGASPPRQTCTMQHARARVGPPAEDWRVAATAAAFA